MYEVLRDLPKGAFVLDLGSRRGSFPASSTQATVIRFDLDAPASRSDSALFVNGDASRLPFKDQAFAAVIANHSLEHIRELSACLQELGRVTCGDGALFAAVPDASTLSDKIYRWLLHGGGHVNAFFSATEVANRIEAATGLRHVATRQLCSSLSFLDRSKYPTRLPRRVIAVGGGYREAIFLYSMFSRPIDRWFRTRFSSYGWALWFGSVLPAAIDRSIWRNVCIRCGSGNPAGSLIQRQSVRRVWGIFRVYRCPECGAANPFHSDAPPFDSVSK